MNVESLRELCLLLPETSEKFPFDQDTLVFYVNHKMFALVGLAKGEYVNLKCDPERAQQLRESYEGIRPGYHMSKVHWNSVYFDQDVAHTLFVELVLHSYELVVTKQKKVDRERILSQLSEIRHQIDL